MKLEVIVEDSIYHIKISEEVIKDGEEFFQKMDRDMNHGWQMGPEFVEQPDALQRCQIAANKLMVSIGAENTLMSELMAGYILKRLPGVASVTIDTDGEMLNTEFSFGDDSRNIEATSPRRPIDESEALTLADQDVSQVYKVGKVYRFAVRDRTSGQWVESPFSPDEEQAGRMRDEARKRLAAKLQRA